MWMRVNESECKYKGGIYEWEYKDKYKYVNMWGNEGGRMEDDGYERIWDHIRPYKRVKEDIRGYVRENMYEYDRE